MEEGSPLEGLTSSPPPFHEPTNQHLGSAMEIEQSSLTLPTIELPTHTTTTTLPNESFLFSSDPLHGTENFQSTDQSEALYSRKRTFPGQHLAEPHKLQKPVFAFGNQSKDLVLQARDLIVKASAAATTHTEQSSLLDLLEVFRDFTENGRVKTASTILATQVASLETTTRNMTRKAQQLATVASNSLASAAKPNSPNPPAKPDSRLTPGSKQTFASVAKQQNKLAATSEGWETVSYAKRASPTTAPTPKRPRQTNNRLVLLQTAPLTTSHFSPIQLRNELNKAFAAKGIAGPVVATVTRSISQNIVVTTTPGFSASFLLEKKAIWEHIAPHKSAQVDTPWFKVVAHGIPIHEFDNSTGMQLVVDEIKTFNQGFTPIGTPYWLTHASKRTNQQAGSVVVAFATEQEANRAIRQRLFIAGISVRCEKLHSTAATTQCNNCQGYGHLDSYCKRQAVCRLCAEKHSTPQHHCSTCNTKGTRCQHLAPKCINCSQAHVANTKTCEVFVAINNKRAATTSL